MILYCEIRLINKIILTVIFRSIITTVSQIMDANVKHHASKAYVLIVNGKRTAINVVSTRIGDGELLYIPSQIRLVGCSSVNHTYRMNRRFKIICCLCSFHGNPQIATDASLKAL